MKKILCIVLAFVLTFSLAACGQTETDTPTSSDNAPESSSQPSLELDNGTENEPTDGTPITLTIGDTVLEAYLNDSAPAQSLMSQLPLTVTLNDSDNDFCGDNLDIEYSESDVTSGYQNGDLVFWPTANNFVIFVSGEEDSASTGNLVKLGRITSPQEMLDALEGQIDVTIALKEATESNETENSTPSSTPESATSTESEAPAQEGTENMQIKITVGDTELFATLEDNATTRALIEQMPMTLSMDDLYGREMCYRYGANALPTDSLRSDGYEVGDIAYWPPRGSLVILYEQNGEQFERQHLGHIDSGVEVFATTGNADVTFEVID